MKLDDLIQSEATSLTPSSKKDIDQKGYRRDITQLRRYHFWSETGKKPHLWDHQKAAIGTIVAYLNGDKRIPERPEHQEAALLKLPTGTGKSGIIAVIGRCLAKPRRVLVLTPREALTNQLLKDIRYRFWGHMGYQIEEGKLFAAQATDFGADLETVYTETFLPSRCLSIVQNLKKVERCILVGTHQALDKIRRTATDEENSAAAICRELLAQIKNTFDLVVVDEGHYEPAVSWSRGVRDFNLPTVLLSATPYRNDYKSFRVRGRYIFNYSYADAVKERVVRPIQIVPATGAVTDGDAAVSQFVNMLKSELPGQLKTAEAWFNDTAIPKVMVRADDLDKLEQLQAAIDKAFKTKSVLIHDRAKKSKENQNRFTSVSSANRARPDAQYWIHQFKLMEGIDDPCFVAVAIFDLMGNARQLVQQIGRVTRYSRHKPGVKQTGWIFGTPANVERIETSWKRYAAYEGYAAEKAQFIVSNEVTLPDRLLELMAEYQYVSGEFRARFEYEAPLAAKDIQLPQSAAVLQVDGALGDIKDLAPVVEEAILDKDRFKITPISNMPKDTFAFSYYAWRNSPLLVDRFFSEWKLGVFIAVRQGNFVFMNDTEGLVVDLASLSLKRADRSLMEKAFPDEDAANTSRLSRMSFSSLEMSQQAIRSMAVRTRSFEAVFTDLLDPSLVPTTAFGFVNGNARYVAFVRSRIREATERYVAVQDYIEWTSSVARELLDAKRKRSGVFGRYAQVVGNLTLTEAAPVSILLDFARDPFIDMRADSGDAAQKMQDEEPDYEDLCADIDPDTNEFTIRIKGEDVPCSIEYREKSGKYRIKSERLNELFPAEQSDDRRQRQTIVQRLNQDQSFRVLTQREGIVYAEGRFYEPKVRWTEEDGSQPILDFVYACPSLEDVTSEKGEDSFAADRTPWYRTSIFGLLSAVCDQQLAGLGIANDDLTREIAAYPIWLCDDDSRETMDFVGIDGNQKKIVFLHAKMGKQEGDGTGFNVSSLQDVGRQALASLAFISRGEPSPVWTKKRWESNVKANKKTLKGRNRIFRNAPGLGGDKLNEKLIQACRNPSFEKEIWVVGANMTSRSALSQGLKAKPPINRLRQLLMHWDGLQTGCARASVRLRWFCDA
jgi:superfamily II DNA or RNA helicase